MEAGRNISRGLVEKIHHHLSTNINMDMEGLSITEPLTDSFSNNNLKYSYPSISQAISSKYRYCRPFTCSVCQKSFTQKHVLDDHFRIHTGEKPFVCDLCKRGFRQKNNLKRHMKCHHKFCFQGTYCIFFFSQNY